MYLQDERDAVTQLAVHVGARGRLSVTGGRRLLYNPEYELRP